MEVICFIFKPCYDLIYFATCISLGTCCNICNQATRLNVEVFTKYYTKKRLLQYIRLDINNRSLISHRRVNISNRILPYHEGIFKHFPSTTVWALYNVVLIRFPYINRSNTSCLPKSEIGLGSEPHWVSCRLVGLSR